MKKSKKLSIFGCLILLFMPAIDLFAFANTIDEKTSASVEETIASDAVLSPDFSVEEPTDESTNHGQETSDLNDTSTSDVSETSSSSEEINNDSGESGELKKSSSSDETTNPKDNLIETRSTITGKWGTVSYSFSTVTGQLDMGRGEVPMYTPPHGVRI
ncbi:hypothetical protein YS9_3339 [Enterococcus sp. C1]|uniref:hypothetical protein n=1 Tax=Enterococcus sp. C1 TaxID=1182762 RepID=UPI0002721930|nr:hypothetical protein [Enterococcus sp. C1]EJF48111.1 hypothetical protein YS9_3339 [Enterococcus sp. C1]